MPSSSSSSDRRKAPRFRSSRTCTLMLGEQSASGLLRDVSAVGAFVETDLRAPLGTAVGLHHPEAGHIVAVVVRHAREGLALAFDLDEAAVAFALRAISTDMTTAAGQLGKSVA